jgi:NAD(P)-dependent dehydrogenase (short-subunit alcohol dehydrogenase family)
MTDALSALAEPDLAAVRSCAGDISDPSCPERLVELALSRFGRLDIAVNNAGIGPRHDVSAHTPLDVARKIIDIDLMGVFYAMRAQLPALEKQFRDTGRGRSNRQCRLGGRRCRARR